jgi:hypothetical protein
VPVGPNPKALKILKSIDPNTGKRTFYYLEYRTRTGFDGSLTPGVIVRTGSESSGNSTYTWDLLQSTSSTDWLLDVGQSYTDEAAGITLTTLSADASGASVFVSFGPTACLQVNPTLAIAPSATQWTRPGHPVSYTATVTNNDTSGCSAANFDLAAAAPAGWTAAFSKSPLSVGPGANASASLTLTSPLDAHGFQTVPVKATNQAAPAYTASASATQMVVTALDVVVSTDKAAYSRNQQVTIQAIVRVEGSPASNASVTFTVTKPNGAAVMGRVATDTTGTAAFKVRLNKKDPVGTYAVTATADLNGVSGTASTSFTAQ